MNLIVTERDVCTKLITPAVVGAGWDVMTQVREEVAFTAGRIIVRGNLVTRGKLKRADYLLYYKPNIPLALIEAKDPNHNVEDGLQQGLDYAATLGIPFVFSSNGEGFVFHDRTGTGAQVEVNLKLDEFPSPAELWARYRQWKGLTPEAEQVVLEDYFWVFKVTHDADEVYVAINRDNTKSWSPPAGFVDRLGNCSGGTVPVLTSCIFVRQ